MGEGGIQKVRKRLMGEQGGERREGNKWVSEGYRKRGRD